MKKLFVVLLFLIHSLSLQIYAISQNELNSLTWIVKQYKINIQTNQFECGFDDGYISITCNYNDYITSLSIDGGGGMLDQGPPDNDRTILTFPELRYFGLKINDIGRIYNTSKSILSMFTQTSTQYLRNVSIVEPSITELQPNLFSIPYMEALEIYSEGITTLPAFALYPPNKLLYQLWLPISPIASFGFDNSQNTSIFDLDILVAINNQDLFIDTSKFKNLDELNLMKFSLGLTGFNSTITIDTSNTFGLIFVLDTLPYRPNIVLNGSYSNILSLDILGLPSSFSPSNISQFLSLQYLSIKNSPGLFSTFPLINIPENLTTLYYGYNELSEFPIFVFSSNYNKFGVLLNLENNLLAGHIPNQYFDNFDQLFINDNRNINGIIPDGLCEMSSFNFSYTIIQNVPDCIKCYWNTYRNIFYMSSIYETFNPGQFNCDYPYDLQYVSYDATTITIVGNNLGWGSPTDSDFSSVLVPNKKLVYNINNTETYAAIIISRLNEFNIYVSYTLDTFSIVEANLTQEPTYLDGIKISFVINYTIQSFDYYHIWMDENECTPHVPHLFLPPSSNTPIGDLLYFDSWCIPVAGGERQLKVVDQFTTKLLDINFIQTYPIVDTVSSLTTDGGNITLTGTFAPPSDGSYNVTVDIGGTICNIVYNSQSMVVCEISGLNEGYNNLYVVDNGFPFENNELVYVESPFSEIIEYCKQTFNNCSGNGYCDQFGKCICNPSFFGIRCNQDLATGPVILDTTTPSVSIVYNNFNFTFEMLSIQEITPEELIVDEIYIKDLWYISNITEENGVKSVLYSYSGNVIPPHIVNKGGHLIGRSYAAPNLFIEANVLITNSTTYHNVTFGDIDISIPPKSVKISATIQGWNYQSKVNTLRVLYKTPITLDECTNKPMNDTMIQNKDKSSIQFLRAYKDDVEFLGRFPEIAIADGRSVFSATMIVNQTLIPNSDNSSAIVGINIPHCDVCQIDPDFGSLIRVQDKSSKDKCGNEKKSNNMWKIAVGVVVGVVGVAFIAGSITYYIKRKNLRKDRKRMEAKLRAFN